MYKIWQK